MPNDTPSIHTVSESFSKQLANFHTVPIVVAIVLDRKGCFMFIFDPYSFGHYAGLVLAVGWVFNLCSTFQLLRRSDGDLRRIGRTRRLELILNVFGIVVYFLGAFRGFMWFFDIRRRLAENATHDAREAALRRREERFARYMEETYGR
jgi:hypothetical protein